MGKINLSGSPVDSDLMGGRFHHKVMMDRLRMAAKRDVRTRKKRKWYRMPQGRFGARRMYGDDEEIFMGFDRMTDEEIMYTLDRSPDQEYMGGKVKDWFKRRKTRAQALVKKIKAKYKALPKWAKIATGAFAAPLALAAAPAALATAPLLLPKAVPAIATALIAKKAKAEKEKLAKMTPEERKAYLKKKAKRLGIAASILIPGFGITTATTAGTIAAARKIGRTVAARQKARALQQQQTAEQAEAEEQDAGYQAPAASYTTAATMPGTTIPEAYAPAPAQMQTATQDEGEEPEKKKGGIGSLLAMGALAALPFFMK